MVYDMPNDCSLSVNTSHGFLPWQMRKLSVTGFSRMVYDIPNDCSVSLNTSQGFLAVANEKVVSDLGLG